VKSEKVSQKKRAKFLKLAPEVGFEPTTNRLTADRSTTELLWITGAELQVDMFAQWFPRINCQSVNPGCVGALPLSYAGSRRARLSGVELCAQDDVQQVNWLRGLDLNQRPSGYEPDELPGCSTPRDENTWDVNALQIEKESHLDETHLSFTLSRLR
jgi:hypothetical protein